jgi:hypothetical protein
MKFFTGFFLSSLLLSSVESWMLVNDHIVSSHVPPTLFHMYRLVACLQRHSEHSLLLQPVVLTLLKAKQLGIFTYYLFAMMDLTHGAFSDETFAKSILGQRMKAWSSLPGSAAIDGLWNQSPLQATYQWFASLQSLFAPCRVGSSDSNTIWNALLSCKRLLGITISDVRQPAPVQHSWSDGLTVGGP